MSRDFEMVNSLLQLNAKVNKYDSVICYKHVTRNMQHMTNSYMYMNN